LGKKKKKRVVAKKKNGVPCTGVKGTRAKRQPPRKASIRKKKGAGGTIRPGNMAAAAT